MRVLPFCTTAASLGCVHLPTGDHQQPIRKGIVARAMHWPTEQSIGVSIHAAYLGTDWRRRAIGARNPPQRWRNHVHKWANAVLDQEDKGRMPEQAILVTFSRGRKRGLAIPPWRKVRLWVDCHGFTKPTGKYPRPNDSHKSGSPSIDLSAAVPV